MCWSGEASTIVAACGISTAIYVYIKKEHPALWLTLLYFSLMESLQAYTYTVIDDCSNPANQVATLLGYIHIIFQPFFINALSMYFIPDQIRVRIQIPVYGLCFISVILMLIQLYPFDWAGGCLESRALCGSGPFCSFSGSWHIAWNMPLNGIGNFMHLLYHEFPNPLTQLLNSGYSYGIVAFLLPLLYGSWPFTIYHLFAGPLLSKLLSDNNNEQPAIWCLVSFAILLLSIETPLRQKMFVRRWFWWGIVDSKLSLGAGKLRRRLKQAF